MKTSNIIRIISIYLLLSGLICLFYLAVVIFRHELNGFNAWVSIIFPGLMIGVTIFNNIDILVSRKVESAISQKLIINGIICLIQVFSVSTSGFFYQYVQGSRLILIVSFEHLTRKAGWGYFFDFMALEFGLKFNPSDHTLIGINLVPLAITIFCLWKGTVRKEQFVGGNKIYN